MRVFPSEKVYASEEKLDRFFLRVPLSHLLKGQKKQKNFWLVIKVLITQIMLHFPAAVSKVVTSVIYVKIILEKVKCFVAVLPSVFAIRYYTTCWNCKSKNVIYPVTCNKCKVQHVGSTSNEFKIRFRNHKSAMSTKKTTCEVAMSILTKRNINYLTLNSLQLNKSVISTRSREAFWCTFPIMHSSTLCP